MDLTALLVTLAPYIVPVIVTLAVALASVLYKALMLRLPASSRNLVAQVIDTAVRAVEQSMPSYQGSEKKNSALREVKDMLAHLGLSVPDAILASMIEAAVYGLNQEQSFADAPAAPVAAPAPAPVAVAAPAPIAPAPVASEAGPVATA